MAHEQTYRCRGSFTRDAAAALKRMEAAIETAKRQESRLSRAAKNGSPTAEGDLERQVAARERLERSMKAVKKAAKKAAKKAGDGAGTGVLVRRLVEADPDAARDLVRLAYTGCGQDLTETIMELPQDGESHDFVCPACGAEQHATRTPPKDEDAAA